MTTKTKKKRSVAATAVVTNEKIAADHASNTTDSGDSGSAHEANCAESVAVGGGEMALAADLTYATICRDLEELQKQRQAALKSRITIENQLCAIVASAIGYRSEMEKSERDAIWDKARGFIKSIDAGDESIVDPGLMSVSGIVDLTKPTRDGFGSYVKGLEKEMAKLTKKLPIASWVNKPELRGFGILSLAVIVGEAGDLSGYPNHMHLWKRFGCAPFKGRMPSEWRKVKGGLTAEEWEWLGYKPQRRSIAYLIGENICKMNHSQYRQKYDEAKASKVGLEDWPPLRAHRHGMLLATKMLLKDLWRAWRDIQTGATP